MIEPPNAYNINGVYIPREVSSASIFDVERIEVLPGPQGTLYGRGAIGGVINTVTKRPGDEVGSDVTVEAGNYAMFRATAAVNLPISDNLRARVAVSTLYHDGYLRSGGDSAEDLAAFVGIDFTPSNDLSVYLWAHVENKGGHSANLLSKGTTGGDKKSQSFPNGDPWDDRLIGPLAGFASVGEIDAEDKDWETLIIGGEIKWQINDAYSLTYIPSYLDFEWNQQYWLTHKLGVFGEEIDQITQELRLNYDGDGAISWMAGLYYYQIETSGQLFISFGQNELLPPFLGGNPNGAWLDATDVRDHELTGLAAFGQGTWELSDSTRVVFGGRVSKDERDGWGYQPFIMQNTPWDPVPETQAIPAFGLPAGISPTWEADEDWTNVDFKVGFEMDVLEDSMLYANIQTGFQPGTFDTVGDDIVTEESQLLAFTVGIKNRFMEGRLLLNNEFFYYQYDDLLTQAWDAASGVNRLTNADTDIWGDQLDIQYTPNSAPNTRLKLSLGYLYARYDTFSDPKNLGLAAFEDNQLQNAPDFTATFGLIQDWDLKSGAFVRADLSSRYESGYWGDFSHSPGMYQESYTKTDATLTYHSADDSWTVGIWVKNLEDQDVQAAAAPGDPTGAFDPAPGAPFLEAPRTFGVRYTAKIGK